MLIGYARVSKADGSQSLDLQHDALRAAGVERDNIYDDLASGGRDDRPGLTACLKSLRDGDVLVVWKLDRLGRSLAHLVNTVKELSDRKIGLRVLTGKGAQIDTTTASGRMVFGIFATLAEFERDLIRERTMAGLASARGADENSRSPKLRCVSRKPPWPSAILQFPISARNSASSASLSTDMSVPKASSETMESMFSDWHCCK
ncbi:recombinase family protein [Acinetobacter baumannii]